MKRYVISRVCIALVTILFISFTACGKNAGTTVEKPEDSGIDKAKSASEPQKQVNLTFWDMNWGAAEYSQAGEDICRKYNELNPNIKIKYQAIPWQGRYEAFSTAIASGEPPDVSTGGGYQQNQFAGVGEILPLDSIVKEWEKEGKLDDFPEGMIDYFKYNGTQIGIPFNLDLRGIWYRVDMFKEAGIEIPKTWDDLMKAAIKLTTKDHYGIVFACSDATGNSIAINFFLNNGGGIFTENGESDWTNPLNLQALDYLRSFKDNKTCPDRIASFTQSDADKIFLEGKAAMYFSSMNVGEKVAAQGKGFEDRVGLLPVLESPNKTKGTLVCLNALMAYKRSKNPEEAKEFIKWWSENNSGLWTSGKCSPLPARKSFFDMDYFKNEKFRKEAIDLLIPYMKSGVTRATSANSVIATVDGERWWSYAIQAAMVGEKDDKTILKELDDKMKKLMGE